MAEINNSLALGVKNDSPDIGKTLLTAGQIKEMQAKTALEEASTAQTQQNVDYNAFQQQQNGGYRVPDVNTRAETGLKNTELRSRAANEIFQDPTNSGVQRAFKHFESNGQPLDTLTQQSILKMSPDQRKATALSIMRGGQPSGQAVEQDPGQIAQRAQSQSGGAEVGTLYGPPGGAPGPQGANPAGGPKNLTLLERKKEAEQGAENRSQEFKGYQTEADAAGEKKVALRQIISDADRVRTGKGEPQIQEARKWIQTAANYIPGLDKVVDVNKPVAAFESLEKNRGIVARAAMKGVGGTAASELEAISGSLASGETSHKGVEVNVSQLIGLENAKKARFQAAQSYQDKYGSLKGFAADFNKNAGPAAWVYMSLPQDERASIRESLEKTKEGKQVVNSIARQINYIHTNKLDEGLD